MPRFSYASSDGEPGLDQRAAQDGPSLRRPVGVDADEQCGWLEGAAGFRERAEHHVLIVRIRLLRVPAVLGWATASCRRRASRHDHHPLFVDICGIASHMAGSATGSAFDAKTLWVEPFIAAASLLGQPA